MSFRQPQNSAPIFVSKIPTTSEVLDVLSAVKCVFSLLKKVPICSSELSGNVTGKAVRWLASAEACLRCDCSFSGPDAALVHILSACTDKFASSVLC